MKSLAESKWLLVFPHGKCGLMFIQHWMEYLVVFGSQASSFFVSPMLTTRFSTEKDYYERVSLVFISRDVVMKRLRVFLLPKKATVLTQKKLYC